MLRRALALLLLTLPVTFWALAASAEFAFADGMVHLVDDSIDYDGDCGVDPGIGDPCIEGVYQDLLPSGAPDGVPDFAIGEEIEIEALLAGDPFPVNPSTGLREPDASVISETEVRLQAASRFTGYQIGDLGFGFDAIQMFGPTRLVFEGDVTIDGDVALCDPARAFGPSAPFQAALCAPTYDPDSNPFTPNDLPNPFAQSFVEIGAGTVVGDVEAFGSSEVTMTGGSVRQIQSFNSAKVFFFGGVVEGDIDVGDEDNVRLAGTPELVMDGRFLTPGDPTSWISPTVVQDLDFSQGAVGMLSDGALGAECLDEFGERIDITCQLSVLDDSSVTIFGANFMLEYDPDCGTPTGCDASNDNNLIVPLPFGTYAANDLALPFPVSLALNSVCGEQGPPAPPRPTPIDGDCPFLSGDFRTFDATGRKVPRSFEIGLFLAGNGQLTLTETVVPEPGTALLLAGGLVGLAGVRRRSGAGR